MKKIVAIGGGSGLATLLRSIRDYPLEISALVAMTDDGSSTGRLRKDLKILPPGDIRKCIAALSDNESHLLSLFQHRFKKGLGLKGHNVGNLLITAMIEMYGSFELAIEGISDLLAAKGKVIPTTLESIDLIAEFTDGKKIRGESSLVRYGNGHKIKDVTINKKALTNPRAVSSIKNADLILVGPGSLYTSIIPNYLLAGMTDTANEAKGLTVYISNVSTEKGETEGFSLYDHCRILEQYGIRFDLVLANKTFFSSRRDKDETKPVRKGPKSKFSDLTIYQDLVSRENPLYHDTDKLGVAIWEIIGSLKKYQQGKGF